MHTERVSFDRCPAYCFSSCHGLRFLVLGQSYIGPGHKNKDRKKSIAVSTENAETFVVLTENSVEKIIILMNLSRFFFPMRELIPIFDRQAGLLCESAQLLCDMQLTLDPSQWKHKFNDIRTNEHQGDAMLTEFREEQRTLPLRTGVRRELSPIAMALDDALDVLKDAANALNIYNPAKIDQQLQELTRIILEEAYAIKAIFPLLKDIKKNVSAIVLQADRVTELEHDADEAYEAYVGYIFSQEPDLREMTKYKNLAELYEKATDTEKRVSDCIRILLMRYDG